MLRIKKIDVLSYDILRAGVEVLFKSLAAFWVLSLIPFVLAIYVSSRFPNLEALFFTLLSLFEVILYLNSRGWAAIYIYNVKPAKLLSFESLVVGWGVTWRCYIFLLPLLPLLAIPFIIVETLGLPKPISFISFLFIVFFFSIIANGWSVERVGVLRQEWLRKGQGDAASSAS